MIETIEKAAADSNTSHKNTETTEASETFSQNSYDANLSSDSSVDQQQHPTRSLSSTPLPYPRDTTYAEDVEEASTRKVAELRTVLEEVAKHVLELEAKNRRAEARIGELEAGLVASGIRLGMMEERVWLVGYLLRR